MIVIEVIKAENAMKDLTILTRGLLAMSLLKESSISESERKGVYNKLRILDRTYDNYDLNKVSGVSERYMYESAILDRKLNSQKRIVEQALSESTLSDFEKHIIISKLEYIDNITDDYFVIGTLEKLIEVAESIDETDITDMITVQLRAIISELK